jgi:hypothetical protein
MMIIVIIIIILIYLLQEQWNATWEAAVAATKVIQVSAGILAQARSMTHRQIITLANTEVASLLPSTQLECCYTALILMIRILPMT